jgi:predicted nucleic acid-binding protein
VTHGVDTSLLIAVEIAEHSEHAEARQLLAELITKGDRIALVPQVLAEFVHVATDPRRLQMPFPMDDALQHSERWWNAREVDQMMPTDAAIALFHEWMRRHQLGRKRVLDTMMAAAYRTAGVDSLLTLNFDDFAIFGGFTRPDSAMKS